MPEAWVIFITLLPPLLTIATFLAVEILAMRSARVAMRGFVREFIFQHPEVLDLMEKTRSAFDIDYAYRRLDWWYCKNLAQKG